MADAWGGAWGFYWGDAWGGVSLDFRTVTDTDILQLPLDAVLADAIKMKLGWREYEKLRGKGGTTVMVETGGVRSLGGDKPSFTVKTSKRGY